MKVKNILLEDNGKECRLSADLVLSGFRTKNVFFSTESRYKDFIFADASPFLVASLMRCIKLSDNLSISGTVSKKLYGNLDKIINKIDELKVVKKKKDIIVSASSTEPDPESKQNYIGCFFSAGVDSFYTLLKNLSEGNEKITHLIFVHGFDIPLWNTNLFDNVYARIKKIAEYFKIEIIPVKTNIREISDPHLEWLMAHGGAIAAVALFLRQGFNKIYIAGANSINQLEASGAHPYLDYLWGTENLEIIHDGIEANREEKVKKYIAKSEMALQNIRVCFDNYGNSYNCGKCEKCLRTMIELKIAGVLDSASFNFKSKLSTESILNLELNEITRKYFETSVKELSEINDNASLIEAIKNVLSGNNRASNFKRLYRKISLFDKKYMNGRFFFYAWQVKKRILSLY